MAFSLRLAAGCCAVFLAAAPVLHAEDTPQPSTTWAHLASYRHKADAERGWKVLSESYSSVLYFHAAIREVDLPGKGMGHFFRLYADGEPDMLQSLCHSMQARKLYCVLHPAQN